MQGTTLSLLFLCLGFQGDIPEDAQRPALQQEQALTHSLTPGPGHSSLLDVSCRSRSETAAQGPRPSSRCWVHKPPSKSLFCSPHELQKGKKKNKTLLIAIFSKPEVIA